MKDNEVDDVLIAFLVFTGFMTCFSFGAVIVTLIGTLI